MAWTWLGLGVAWASAGASTAHVDTPTSDVASGGLSQVDESRPVEGFWDTPVSRDLHPVGEQYTRDYFLQLDRNLSGRGASPIYRRPLSELDVRWALEAHNIDPLFVDPGQDLRALELLGVAMSVSMDDWLAAMLGRSPAFGGIHQTVRQISSPSIRIQKSSHGLQVAGADRTAGRDMVAMARLDEQRGPRAPALQTGSGLRIRALDEDEETPLLDVAGWVSGSNIVLDAWRLSGLAVTQSWVAFARQRLYRGVSITGYSRSEVGQIWVASYSLGTIYDLPGPWQLRTTYRHTYPNVDRSKEQRVTVELRALWRWDTPAPPDSFGIGNRPDREGIPPIGGSDHSSYELVQPAEIEQEGRLATGAPRTRR